MGLLWAWEGLAWGGNPADATGNTALQDEGSPGGSSVSVAPPAVSKLLATSAAILAPTASTQRRNRSRAAANKADTFAVATSEGTQTTAEEIVRSGTVRGTENGSAASDVNASAQIGGKGRPRADDVNVLAHVRGNPPAAQKPYGMVDMEASVASRGDAALPPMLHKPHTVPSARAKFSQASIAVRQQ